MNFNRLFHTILFTIAFSYLVMCPAVHEFGDGIRHDLIYKAETKIFKKES